MAGWARYVRGVRNRNGQRMIVVKGKDDTSYLDASDPLTWAASSLKLLTERYEQRWFATPTEIFGDSEPPYTPEQIEALKSLPEGDPARKAAVQRMHSYKQENKHRIEYAKWYEQMIRVVTEQDLSFVRLRDDLPEERAVRAARPIAWQLLDERSDYEYEYVSLETLVSPFPES